MLTHTKQLCVKIILLIGIFFISFFSSDSFAQTTLFQDDFSGIVDRWELQDGWKVVSDNGNPVLSSSQHSFASTGSTLWKNYNLTTKVKLMSTESATHLNYRSQGCDRYFIGFNTGGVYLSKTYPCGTHTPLANAAGTHNVNQWYVVKIVGNAGNIKVYVDDVLEIDFTDPFPLVSGEIAFEGLDNSSVYFDDVVVVSDEPLSLTSWRSTGGPLGGLGYDVRIHPNNKDIMYVTDNYAGVIKSTNAGQKWNQSNTGITVKGGTSGDAVNVFSLTIDPNHNNIVWAGTYGDGAAFGIFKSTDGGYSWEKKNTGIKLGSDVALVFRGFTVQPGDSNIVYAQAEVPTTVQGFAFNRVKGRVYKTKDGGENWQLIWQGNNLARYLIIDPTNLDTLYLSTGIFDREAFNSDCQNGRQGGEGVLKSIDGGQTWAPINVGLTDLYIGSLRMHPNNPQILFAATGNAEDSCSDRSLCGLFMTTNGGASWIKVISGDQMTTVNFSPSSPDTIYAGNPGAFFRSQDGGTTWTKLQKPGNYSYGPDGVRAGFPIDVTVDPDNPMVVYVNNYGGGVFCSIDGAATWKVWSKGYSGADIHAVHVDASTLSTVYAVGRSGPFKSFNYGEDWGGIANGDATSFPEWNNIAASPADSNIVLLTDEHQGVIFRSVNGGDLFKLVFRHPYADANTQNKAQGFRGLAFAPSSPNIIYAGLSKLNAGANSFLSSSSIGTVLYKSQDGGMTFSPFPSTLDGTNVRRLVVDPANANIVYAATTDGVYKSIDGASSWVRIGNLGSNKIEALAIDPLQPGYIIAGEIFGGIWISTNDGASWTGPHNTGFNSSNPYISSLVVDPISPNTVFASDLYSGIYRSLDHGSTWAPFPDWKMSGLSVRAVKDIAISANMMYAATQGGGVFKFDRSEQATRSQVTEIYVATFGRAPDTAGLAYWVGQVRDGYLTIDQVAQSFFDQPETKNKYPSTSNSAFITTIYQNVLNRSPEQGGLNYWVGELNRGAFGRSQAIMAIINGAKATTGSPIDAAILANKEQVGVYFAASKLGTLSDPSKLLLYAKNVMSSINSSAESVIAAKSHIDTLEN